ncbi:RNA methyltransferase [Anaerophaga thermohalophila]|jgi:tRNA G18 (ribose-2'-O)-methylase SpoU|uniref:RNA methyltransferase n=1 Tax=Anaerophaga thermohalophila TaxID=177400 RepID=UPI000303A2FD|nr:RNA methyltransferase [Anaerophaga thermohalophila]
MRKLKLHELGRISVKEFKNVPKTPIIVVLDNIRSLHNVGSIFRTSDAFRIRSIFLCGITATPPHKEIHKTALGAEESVEWHYFNKTTDAVKKLKREGFLLIGIEQTEGSINLPAFEPDMTKKYAVFFGNEVKGVDQKVIDECDMCLEIPQFGTKHSFNVSVSAGIVLWELAGRRLLSD